MNIKPKHTREPLFTNCNKTVFLHFVEFRNSVIKYVQKIIFTYRVYLKHTLTYNRIMSICAFTLFGSVHFAHSRTHMQTHTYTYIHEHTSSNTCTRIYLYIYKYACKHTHTYTHSHTHTYIHVYAYTHTHIHT